MVELRPTHTQRRIASRRAVQLPCEAVRDRGFIQISKRILDLSNEGAFLESDVPLDLGEEVILTFRAPRTRQWMDALGIVVRKIQGKRLGDRARGVGISFLPMSPIDKAVLTATLTKVPPVLPTRRDSIDYASAVISIGSTA